MSFLGISLVAFGAALVLGAVEKALSLTAGSFESFPAEPVYAANRSLGFAIAGVAGLDAEVGVAGFCVEVGVAMAGVAGLDVGVAGGDAEVRAGFVAAGDELEEDALLPELDDPEAGCFGAVTTISSAFDVGCGETDASPADVGA